MNFLRAFCLHLRSVLLVSIRSFKIVKNTKFFHNLFISYYFIWWNIKIHIFESMLCYVTLRFYFSFLGSTWSLCSCSTRPWTTGRGCSTAGSASWRRSPGSSTTRTRSTWCSRTWIQPTYRWNEYIFISILSVTYILSIYLSIISLLHSKLICSLQFRVKLVIIVSLEPRSAQVV